MSLKSSCFTPRDGEETAAPEEVCGQVTLPVLDQPIEVPHDQDALCEAGKRISHLEESNAQLADKVRQLEKRLFEAHRDCDIKNKDCDKMKKILRHKEESVKASLREAKRKHEKALETIDQLEREKYNLSAHVRTLEETIEDQWEGLTTLGNLASVSQKECDQLKDKYERQQEEYRVHKSENLEKVLRESWTKHQETMNTINSHLQFVKSYLIDQFKKTLRETEHRRKDSHCAQKAKRKRGAHRFVHTERPRDRDTFRPRHGTGYRHPAQKWPTSQFTGKSHKMVVPPESPNKKFVFIVGDSHLRGIVDGFVKMPAGEIAFGAMSTPGAHAAQLRTEVLNTALPRTPDLVCLLAPSNNLTAKTVSKASEDFRKLLNTVRSTWPKVFVLDFPPRLNVDVAQQDLLRQEFQRVAAQEGVEYVSIAKHFPLDRLKLWCRDGVHLSDEDGMAVLVDLLRCNASRILNTAAAVPVVSVERSPPPATSHYPTQVVKREEMMPRLLDTTERPRVEDVSKVSMAEPRKRRRQWD